jgi:hypothetical protein
MESAKEAAAARGSPQAAYDPSISEHSAPVEEGGGFVAVAAFGFDPQGHPVQVLSYSNGRWAPVKGLPPPRDPGTLDHPDSLYLVYDSTTVLVGHVTEGLPDFLIPFAGAGCGKGPIVSRVGGSWRYIPFTGPFPTTEVLGGNPQFVGRTLVSDNACAAIVPRAQRRSWTWKYDPATGDFVGTEHVGWPRIPFPVAGSDGA